MQRSLCQWMDYNFSRPRENVANDFGYNPVVARNISVDIRFLRWLLEEVQKADDLVRELGLGHSR